jgi:hypothetical protein
MIGLNPDGSEPELTPSFTVMPPAGGWARYDRRLIEGGWWVMKHNGGCCYWSDGPYGTKAEAQAAGETWLARQERAR